MRADLRQAAGKCSCRSTVRTPVGTGRSVGCVAINYGDAERVREVQQVRQEIYAGAIFNN